MGGCQNYGPFVGSLLYYGTYYLGYPKRHHNFDNHPMCSLPKASESQAMGLEVEVTSAIKLIIEDLVC